MILTCIAKNENLSGATTNRSVTFSAQSADNPGFTGNASYNINGLSIVSFNSYGVGDKVEVTSIAQAPAAS